MSEHKTILVTGAGKGIGRGLAEAMLKRGWQVCGCSRAESTLKHDRYRHYQTNVDDEDSVVSMFRRMAREGGELSALINCAGIARMNPALLTPASSATTIMNTNFNGTFVCCREAAKLMMRRKFGRIVNFGSIAVPLALAGEAVYGASKAAVEHLTRVLARELGGYGITVNCVSPNPIKTGLIDGVPEDMLERLVARQAIPRFGEIDDVINAVDFFLRPESSLVTGQTVYLGGPP